MILAGNLWHLLGHPEESLPCDIVARSWLLKLLKEGSLYLSNASPCVKRYVGLQMSMPLVDTEKENWFGQNCLP